MKHNRIQIQKILVDRDTGFALVTTLYLIFALTALMAAYFITTKTEILSTRASGESARGFYIAEAGLNLRAQDIRQIFVGYNRPEGVSPEAGGACQGGNTGSGDFICETYDFGERRAVIYVEEDPESPVMTTIPPGELYQNLSAQEYRYSVKSTAFALDERISAILELRFKSRLVPLFQFAVFYDKDLEILPGPAMNLAGPVHTNSDLYLNSENANPGLRIEGQVTVGGNLYRGRKNNNACQNTVRVFNNVEQLALVPGCSSRTLVNEAALAPWNGMIEIGVDTLTVPEPEALDPTPGQIYWDKADLRLVLRLDENNLPITSADSTTGVEVREEDGSLDSAATALLHSCPGDIDSLPVGTSDSFYNNREGRDIRMLEVDTQNLLNCLHQTDWFGSGKGIDDTSEGGLVFHFSHEGPDAATVGNPYGVRLRNSARIASTLAGAPDVRGLTVVTDQAAYTHGDYNAVDKLPASILSDSLNILSNAWNLNDSRSTQALGNRAASNTTINAAVLSGTDSTGGTEGPGGQGGAYNGGVENYPRLHEDWTNRALNYRGSFVSLSTPRRVNGGWQYGAPQYTAPIRNWDYDTDFNDASKLPPLSPRFVYLRQELFVREFEQ